MRPTEVIVRRSRWLAWRDLVMVLLAIAVVLLVRQMGSLQAQLRQASALRSQQIQALTAQVEGLRRQLVTKDARIRQLTDLLIRHAIPVPPAPSPSPMPGPTFTPRPSADRDSPTPHPRPEHSPTVRPTPSCAAVLAGTCLNPPSTSLGHPPLALEEP